MGLLKINCLLFCLGCHHLMNCHQRSYRHLNFWTGYRMILNQSLNSGKECTMNPSLNLNYFLKAYSYGLMCHLNFLNWNCLPGYNCFATISVVCCYRTGYQKELPNVMYCRHFLMSFDLREISMNVNNIRPAHYFCLFERQCCWCLRDHCL